MEYELFVGTIHARFGYDGDDDMIHSGTLNQNSPDYNSKTSQPGPPSMQARGKGATTDPWLCMSAALFCNVGVVA
jgi:hypothetical protein